MELKNLTLVGILSIPMVCASCISHENHNSVSSQRQSRLEQMLKDINHFDKFSIALFRILKEDHETVIEISPNLARELSKTSYFPLADANNYLKKFEIKGDNIRFEYSGRVAQEVPGYKGYLEIRTSQYLKFKFKPHINSEGKQTHVLLKLVEGEIETVCNMLPFLNLDVDRIVIGPSKEYQRSMSIANSKERKGALIDIGKGTILHDSFYYNRLVADFE